MLFFIIYDIFEFEMIKILLIVKIKLITCHIFSVFGSPVLFMKNCTFLRIISRIFL